MGQTWNGDIGHDLGNVVCDIGGWFSGPPGDPGRIRQCASQVEGLRDRLDGDRRALNESIDELTTTWTGDGATAFHGTWYGGGSGAAPAAVLEQAHHTLDQFARQLYDYADQLQHAQEEHWISMGIMAALTIVNAVQLGADPATDAAEVGVATGTAVGTSFALESIGTMAIEGAAFGLSSNVVSQLGADLLDRSTRSSIGRATTRRPSSTSGRPRPARSTPPSPSASPARPAPSSTVSAGSCSATCSSSR